MQIWLDNQCDYGQYRLIERFGLSLRASCKFCGYLENAPRVLRFQNGKAFLQQNHHDPHIPYSLQLNLCF